MSALEPLYAALLPAGGGTTLFLAFRFLQWIRNNRVEDAKTVSERLEAENIRLSAKVDAAEAEAEGWKTTQETTRTHLHYEQDYSSMLRQQLLEANIVPHTRAPQRKEGHGSEGS
jgi:regulatory protein YycI of two-component signal transduction system YycFG